MIKFLFAILIPSIAIPMYSKLIVNDYDLLPSLVGGLVKSNGDRIIDNYGKLKLTDNKNMVNDDTTYIIGSCSKSMLATAIMKIFYVKEPNNQNPMNLTIGEVIKTGIKPDYQNVTLKQLLCMRSGINDDNIINVHFWKHFINNSQDLKSQRASLMIFVIGPNSPMPVHQYSYSNLGYIIAAHIAEIYFNTTYEEMMNVYLFQPLNIQVQLPIVRAPVHSPFGNNATGHSIMSNDKERYNGWLPWYNNIFEAGTPVPTLHVKNSTGYVVNTVLQAAPPVAGPAGLIRLGIGNWLTYLEAVMMHNSDFLPEERWYSLLNTGYPITNTSSTYSFGWVYYTDNPQYLFYTGYIQTFTADLVLKQKSFALATMTNSGRGKDAPSIPMVKLELALCPKDELYIQKHLQSLITNLPKSRNDPWIPKSK